MASYSFIDPQTAFLELALGSALGTPLSQNFENLTVDIPPIECELSDEWKEFENELGKFKAEFKRTVREHDVKKFAIDNINKRTVVSKLIANKVEDDDLKAKLLSVIDNHESEAGLDTLTQQCGELRGKYEAMSKVLTNTHSERYDRFICPICCECFIDLFIDPCGHVICDHCWLSTRDKRHCPMCKGNCSTKKIYTI